MSSSYVDEYIGHGGTPVSRPGSTVSQTTNDPSVCLMRLKVLYTFDEQNQTNCLARWHALLPVRTAFLDERTQIGVVELKTCLQAVVSASPELIGKLGHDYTVYAYDYSEYETPLVGQGMLSWMLSSAVPIEPAHKSRKMVTGRVSKNVLGLFAGGAEETLEVKLRLIPVPHCLQSEYIQNMNKYHDISKKLPPNFDPQVWSDLLKNNPGLANLLQQSTVQSQAPSHVGIEHVQRLMLPELARPSIERELSYDGYQASSGSELDQIRPSSSASNIRPSVPQPSSRPASRQSTARRPSSRASNSSGKGRKRSRKAVEEEGRGEEPMVQEISEERQDDGTVKKRAKVVKAAVPRKALVSRVDSLRVAASEAASVRVHQPTAVRPSANPISNLEEPPRAPTPIPKGPRQPLRGSLSKQRSSLGMEAMTLSDSSYVSPYMNSDDQPAHTESATTTPDSNRAPSVPRSSISEIASSPPSLIGACDASVTPSSPALPVLPHELAGFGSNNINSLFEDDGTDDEGRSPDEFDREVAMQYSIRPELRTQLPGAHSLASRPSGTHNEPTRPGSSSNVQMNSTEILRHSSTTANTNSQAPRASLNRASTWSAAPAPSSEADVMDGESEKQKRKYPPWNKEARKAAITTKLHDAVKNGQMPPFCMNCGVLETPTWRKLWEKEVEGQPDEAWLADGANAIYSWHVLEKDDNGVVKKYKIVKKLGNRKEETAPNGFKAVLICNPCGIWYAKYKSHRPEEQWYNVKGGRRGRARGKYTGEYTKKQKEIATKHTEVISDIKSDVAGYSSGASSPAFPPSADGDTFSPEEAGLLDESDLPLPRPRANSAAVLTLTNSHSEGLPEHVAVEALRRAIESSPGRHFGISHGPIEINDTSPKPTRRSLFPSPKGKSPLHPSGDPFFVRATTHSAPSSPLSNKTNRQDVLNQVDTILVENGDNVIPHQPNTPPAQTTSILSPYKSAVRSTSTEDFSQFLRTPTGKTPPAGRGIPDTEYFMSAARKFLEQSQTPSRTPSKAPSHHHSNSDPIPAALPPAEMTPFTRQLNAILSEAGVVGTPSKTPSANINMYQPTFVDGFDFSDAPMPSSPPVRNMATGWFSSYELPPDGGWDAMVQEAISPPEPSPGQYETVNEDLFGSPGGNEMDGIEGQAEDQHLRGGEKNEAVQVTTNEIDELVIVDP